MVHTYVMLVGYFLSEPQVWSGGACGLEAYACWRMRSEISGGLQVCRAASLHESCMSRSLPNIHLDGSPAVSFAFFFLSFHLYV